MRELVLSFVLGVLVTLFVEMTLILIIGFKSYMNQRKEGNK